MFTQEEQQSTDAEARSSVLAEISNTMVRVFRDQLGRGPLAARTQWAGSDALVRILEGTLTPAERRLVKLGEHQRLRELRLFFQYSSVREFCEPVEQITGRKVRSFHSSTDTQVDGQAVEVFMLHPEGYEGPSRIDHADQ